MIPLSLLSHASPPTAAERFYCCRNNALLLLPLLLASCRCRCCFLLLPSATFCCYCCHSNLVEADCLVKLSLKELKRYKDNLRAMFTNDQRQAERTGKHGTPRPQYLQELVTQFQTTTDEESKEKVVAHLANFSYDPYNYTFLRQLNVLELFLDCITEENEKLIEFGVGGICNSCIDPANAAIIIQCDGIPLVIQCLTSPVRNTVKYALGALYYLCNSQTKEEILKPEVVEVIRRYASAEVVNVCFSNLAKAFLVKHVNP